MLATTPLGQSSASVHSFTSMITKLIPASTLAFVLELKEFSNWTANRVVFFATRHVAEPIVLAT
jgi:hypothetical protein